MARSTADESSAAWVTRDECLVSGALIAAWSISWNEPQPSSDSGESPESSSTGLSDCSAEYSGPMPLEMPGAAVSMATPIWPVTWAQASAMNTAAASWRTCTMRMPASMQASYSGMIWLPERLKIVVTPRRARVWMTSCAPNIDVLPG